MYYGDEAGVCGFTDPDNRRTYPWGKEDKKLIEFHKEMIRIHKKYKVFNTGSVNMLGWKKDVLAYSRFDDTTQIVVAINNSRSSKGKCDEKTDLFLRRWIYNRTRRIYCKKWRSCGEYGTTLCISYEEDVNYKVKQKIIHVSKAKLR